MDKVPETYRVIVRSADSPTGKLETFPTPKPGKDEVLVKIHFAPINPSDASNLAGRYAAKGNTIGFEGSGEVAAVGEDLKQPVQVGDKVSIFGLGGTWGEYIILSSTSVLKVPPGLSLQEAACPFVNPGTVVSMGLITNETESKCALHTCGSSTLGKMMIRHFKKIGLKLISIVRKQEYVDELLKEGTDYVLNSTSENFDKELQELVTKENCQVCFDALAGDMTGKVLKKMPNGSAVYVYGALSGDYNAKISVGDLIFSGKKVTGFWLNQFISTRKPEEVQKLFYEVMTNLSGTLKSKVQKVFKLEDLASALQLHASSGSQGKVLLTPW